MRLRILIVTARKTLNTVALKHFPAGVQLVGAYTIIFNVAWIITKKRDFYSKVLLKITNSMGGF